MEKELTYKELLEKIDIEILVLNKITIGENNLWIVNGKNTIGVVIPEKVVYSENSITYGITCNNFALTIWKGVRLVHITVF
jgi:hypothetical protein